MKDKKGIIAGIVLLIVVIIGSTYAYYKWSSTANIDIDVSIEGSTVTFVGGTDVTGTLIPSASKEDAVSNNRGIKKEVTVVADALGSTMSLYLDLDKIPDGVKDKSFKYEVYYKANGATTETLVSSGNFAAYDATNNSTGVTYATSGTTTVDLFLDRDVNTTTDTYILYLWFDGTMDNPTSMQNHTTSDLSFSLHASGTGATLKS